MTRITTIHTGLPLTLTVLVTFLIASPASVQAQVALCRNIDWVDEDGCGCEEYDSNMEWCDLYGEFVFEGNSADVACCACGGGRKIAIDTAQTDPPIIWGQKNCILSPPIQIAPGLTVENWMDNDDLQFQMRIVYEGKAWIGISFENNGLPGKPPFAVIGRLDDEASGSTSVKKYALTSANPDASGVVEMAQNSQTLEDASFLQTTSGKTVMTFTKATNEIFDNPQQIVTDRSTWIFAVGLPGNKWTGGHAITGKFNIALTPCYTNPWEITNPSINGGLVDSNARRSFVGEKPQKQMWIVHGIVLAVAWGIIAPLGLGTTFFKWKGPKWSKMNQFCNTALLLLTCAGILLGVVATYLDDRATHLQTDHSYFGVGVFGGLLLYCLLALYFGAKGAQEEKEAAVARGRQRALRPTPPPAPRRRPKPAATNASANDRDVILGMGHGMEVLPGDSPHNPRNPTSRYMYSDDEGFPEWDEYDIDSTPPPKVSCLEWFSRLLFLGCIAAAYYTCHTGLGWQLVHFDLDWEQYYWGLGAAGAAILVLLVSLSCCCCLGGNSNGGRVVSVNQEYYSQAKSVSLGAQDSMQGSVAQQITPHNPYEPPFFPKIATEEDTFYPPDDRTLYPLPSPFGHHPQRDDDTYKDLSIYNDDVNSLRVHTTTHTNTNHRHAEGQLQYLEDDDAQRSPMRKSWDVDCCQL